MNLDDLQAQLGDLFWVVAIGAPVLVLVLVGRLVLRARLRTRQLEQAFRSGSIVTDRSAPTTGPLAFGLACGAQLALNQGVAWNDIAGAGRTRPALRERLARTWGVRSHGEWQRAMDGLLAERGEQPNDLAMALRWEATVVRTVPPDLAGWQRIIHQAARYGQISSHGVPMLLAAAERISRYEDRFRADGLVSPLGVVHSARAYDWGRAVTLARWGLRAGYCDKAAAERVILRAGELCARHYMSWPDLSAAFSLGRMLFLDDEDFPVNYIDVREAQRRLLTEDGSPWRTMAWPTPVPRP